MNKLVIAEKPSVARSYAAVLGADHQGEGFLEGNGYLISWCYGHLTGLANADTYDERYVKWRREDLPIIPAHWRYMVSKGKEDQFKVLKELMKRDDVSEVVNGCDAGREGELIFRNLYELAGCTKPIQRLWVSSMEDIAIQEGFKSLKPGLDYEQLFQAARCREQADWLVGINATRLFSVMYHRTLNIGRVMSPTLSMIVERDAEIAAFQPQPFYTVQLTAGGITAESERFTESAQANELADKCRNGSALVTEAVRKEKSENAPALFDLTTLQREANRKLGYTAQQTLDYAQALYEKKLITYPRTDARFLTDDMADSAAKILPIAERISGLKGPESPNTQQVCNSKKVSDHHAIIPTLAAEKADLEAVPAGEREILKLVAARTLCAVSAPLRYAETVVTLTCADAEFNAKGKTILDLGWKALSDEETKETVLPEVSEQDTLTVSNVEVHEGKTTPPKNYTEDSLLAAMEAAGAKDMPEDAERKGLGTPATRAGIIEKLISIGFVERKKSKKRTVLVATSLGTSLVAILPPFLKSADLTAEWENKLKMVEHSELTAGEFNQLINLLVNKLVKEYIPVPGSEVLFPSGRPVVGKCPRCGSDVTEGKKGFFCENNDCRFALWRDNKFLDAKKINLTTKLATALLKDGWAKVKNIFSERTGKSYDATLLLKDDGTRVSYGFDFGKDGAQD